MRIRFKAIIMVGITVLLLVGALFFIYQFILNESVEKQEIETTLETIERVQNMMFYENENLNAIVADWAIFDDTYQYISDANQEFIDENVTPDIFENLNIQFIVFIDNQGDIVYQQGYDYLNSQSLELPEEIQPFISKGSYLLSGSDLLMSSSGLAPIQDQVIMLSSHPITDSSATAQKNGTLLMGRFLDAQKIEQFEGLTNAQIRIEQINENSRDSEYQKLMKTLRREPYFIQSIDEETIEGYLKLEDANQQNTVLLTITANRDAYQKSKDDFQLLLLALILSILIVFAVFLWMLEKTVILRLEKLNHSIKNMDAPGGGFIKIETYGNDEIASLSDETNKMLERIQSAEDTIMKSQLQLKRVIEGSNDGFWDWDINQHQIEFSDYALEMLGCSKDEVESGEEILSKLTHPDDLKGVLKAFEQNFDGSSDYYGRENRMMSKDGIWKWFLIRGKVVEHNEDGTSKRMAGTITDISDRKKTEEEIRFLSYNDKLTGLYNRAYFEKEFDHINATNTFPYSFIMGDMNGLKLANDVFGHEEGDKLLRNIAHVLKASCRESDIIARWGGDEFAILLVGANEEVTKRVCERIQDQCLLVKDGMIKPSIALGFVTKSTSDQEANKLQREAETIMYQNKLIQGRLTQLEIISSLKQMLNEEGNETQEHTRSMMEIGYIFAERLELDSEEIEKLMLLIEIHDIGKISVPIEILKKQGPLTEEEFIQVKKHSEVGYRISKAIPDISHVANLVLYHHEHFNGEGYPEGLKGLDIPLCSRIFLIIDAYGVMTQDNYYKKAVSKKLALEEIERCSGTQFDPELAKKFIEMMRSEVFTRPLLI